MGNWDAIVFSEVLPYLAVHEAIAEVRRYAKALSPEGIVAISMMNDSKEPSDLARVAPRVSMDRRHSLAAKGAVALLPDQREPRAPRLSRRRARITAQALKAAALRNSRLKRRGEQEGRQSKGQHEKQPTRRSENGQSTFRPLHFVSTAFLILTPGCSPSVSSTRVLISWPVGRRISSELTPRRRRRMHWGRRRGT